MTLVTVALVIRLGLPSQLVIGPLGEVGAPATLIGVLLFGYWFWHRLRLAERRRTAAVNVAAIGFGMVALASYGLASARPTDPVELNLSLGSLLILTSWLGGLLLTSDGVTTFARLRTLLARLAILSAAFSSFGLVQFLTGQAWVDRLSIPGLVVNTPIYSSFERGGFYRPFSTSIHPIEFGAVIAMLLPLTIVYGMLGPVRTHWRWLTWIPALLTAIAGALSSSRSTLIGLAVGLVLLWPALKPAQRFVGGIATAALATFVFVTVPGMVGTILSLFNGVATLDSSIASRVDSFSVAADYFGRTPILGRGFGTFLPRYRIFDDQYLLGLVETGVVGFVSMILLWGVPVVGDARVIRRSEPGSPQRLVGAALLSSCVVGGVGLAFFDGFGFPMMPSVWFVLLGMSGAYIRLARQTSPSLLEARPAVMTG